MKQTYISNSYHRVTIVLFLIFIPFVSILSQTKRLKVNEDYIKKYKDIAINNMKKYKIPASITLAQGIAESGAGRSALTLKSNNHFGIKCHKEWTGPKAYHNDDAKNECFRKYSRAEDSFEDHSLFLSQRERYSPLFSLSATDYKGWAKGLQKAGYATDQSYANKLIKVIEDYDLHLYDKSVSVKTNSKGKNTQKESNKDKNEGKKGQGWSLSTVSAPNPKPTVTKTEPRLRHIPYKTYNLVYVIALKGDTYESIASEFDFDVNDLYKYNDIPTGFTLKEGDLIYFQKKKSKADKPHYEHVVRAGDSMYSIAQSYGIKVANLYKLNKKNYDYTPSNGDVLKLR